MSVTIEVLEDPARACAALLREAVLEGGQVVLTGGSTPGDAYGELADALRTGGRSAAAATIWFSDERCVAPEDELSNYRLVRRRLLDRLGEVAPPSVMRIEGERGPEAGAEHYEQAMDEQSPLPFDLVLLGLGPDGHIASMFPDQASLREQSRWVLGVPQAGLEPFVPRVTLTFPALASARQIVFLVTGESKADAVAAAFGPRTQPDPHVPASLLVAMADEIKVLADGGAAGRL